MFDTAVKDARASRARRIAENRRRRKAEAATTTRSMRSFCLKWAEQVGWSRKYSAEEAAGLPPDDWAIFIQVVDECHAFIEAVEQVRQSKPEAS